MIATYNRSKSLRRTLESLKNLLVPEETSWEIIIIDNNSTDDTKDTVEEFISKTRLNIIYIYESKQGKPYALNHGLRVAKGEIIAFTDDDVIIDRNWICNILKAFQITNATCIGGKVLPIWEKKPPSWLKQELYGCLALLDLGDECLNITEPTIWGVNMAVRSDFFKKNNFLFNTKFLKRGEDTDLIDKLLVNKEPVYYCPDVIIYHCIPVERMQKSYFRKWKFDQGKFRAQHMGKMPYSNFMGVPLFVIRRVFKKILIYLWLQIISPDRAFVQQARLIHYLGFIAGRLHHKFKYE